MLFPNFSKQALWTPHKAVVIRPVRINRREWGFMSGLVFFGAVMTVALSAQVITMDTRTGKTSTGPNHSSAPVDRRFQQITPTKVPLSNTELDPKTRLELMRVLQAEQGFAMRPFPRGHKGLLLVANGKLEPAGEPYLKMVTDEGLSAKPGDRLVLTDIKIEHGKIIIDLNGGPDVKHRFLRHVEVGAGPAMNPVVQDNEQEPTGARLTLAFEKHIPELTGSEVKQLLAPLISFDVKTPVQAYTDTLPTKLKDAILNHHVLVGMNTEMVIFAKGAPETKTRELDGQMPFEEWIYGKPPKEVEFVRFNGNRVIRLELAKTGERPVIFTKDEVEGLMRTDGTALMPDKDAPHLAKVGDVERDPDTQAPAAPPSLRKDGETLPADSNADSRTGVMKPVRFPKPKPADQSTTQPGANPDEEQTPSLSVPLPDASQPGPPPKSQAPTGNVPQPSQQD
jgi:hypothetical protein